MRDVTKTTWSVTRILRNDGKDASYEWRLAQLDR
jgi:hypothetical protein